MIRIEHIKNNERFPTNLILFYIYIFLTSSIITLVYCSPFDNALQFRCEPKKREIISTMNIKHSIIDEHSFDLPTSSQEQKR